MSCPHKKFACTTRMFYLDAPKSGVRQLMMGVTTKCTQCGEPFTHQAPPGISSVSPTVSPKGELLVPLDYPKAEVVVSSEDTADLEGLPSGAMWIH